MAPSAPPDRPPAPAEAVDQAGQQRRYSRARRPMEQWRGHRTARRWRFRLAPDPLLRKPKGVLPFWSRMRRLFWAWWPWALACLYALVNDKWGWAWGTGAMAVFSYLLTPAETPPQYGLDHEFAIDDEEFLPTMAGATGVPFMPGNRLTILNNGDEFFPAMLDAIRSAEVSITIEAYIYWAGNIGREFAEALAAKASSGVRVKILLDSIGSSTIGEEILEI